MFSRKILVLTYHGLHNRELSDSIDHKLFRNCISENDYLTQLKILKQKVRIKSGKNGDIELIHKDLLFNELRVLLTFDDGYENTLRAAEMFYDVFGTAALTVFLTTNLIGTSDQTIWTVNIGLLILRGEFLNNRLTFNEESFSLNNSQERFDCFNIVRNKLKKMNTGERKHHFDSVLSQAPSGELERLIFQYPEFQMLTLDKIRQMQSIGVRFEPHGHNHELLHAGQSSEVIKREIIDSKKFIETNLNQKCSFFAYPNGDYCELAISILKENGFRGAYTTQVGTAQHLMNNFEIPRITPNPKPNKFKKQLRGKLF